MKTLKFMLAAATAIGLASATQADTQDYNSTGFERLAVDTAVTTGVIEDGAVNSYFYYAGSVAEDNESVIAAAGIARPRGAENIDAGRDNILQVSTGTDPLVRTYAPMNGQTAQFAPITADTYVDTLVQFTVTPYTDTVTPGANDKLMVYLGENTNDVGEVTSKSLKVIAGYIGSSAQVSAKEYEVANVSVDTNTWYRLTVKTIPDISVDDQGTSGNNGHFMGFQIFIDGTLCTLNEKPYDDAETSGAWDLVEYSIYYTAIDNKQMVPSILATSNDQNKSSKLQGVGFAGEGKVDDIVFSTLDPFDFSIVDFTLLNGTNSITAVSFTIAGGEAITQFGTYRAHTNDTIVITPTVASGSEEVVWPQNVTGLRYVEDGTYVLTDTATLTLTVEAVQQQEDWSSDPITPGTPAATQYPALAGTALATADAAKLTAWATANSVAFSDVKTDADTYVEAYLLDCAVSEVDDEKEEFTLTITINAAGEPVVQSPVDRNEKSYNGTVTIKGSTTVNGTYTNPAPSDAKFFKAELSL